MSVLKLLLLPFALLYKTITDFRNHLYNIGYKRSIKFDRYVIGVGNLTVGGTGKTPFVELLIRLLKTKFNLAVLSRGYGRKTKGFRLASKQDNANTLGDEPFQYFTKYGNEIAVTVGEERALAIPELLFNKEDVNLIILDDAFQHRSVTPNFNILLNDYHRPFYKDHVLPMGLLRESRKHANRADIVVVTKCPDNLQESEMIEIEREIKKYSGEDTPVYFTGIRYLEPVSIYGDRPIANSIFLFSGIANYKPLESFVSGQYDLLGHKIFPDHYVYKPQDLKTLIGNFQGYEKMDKSFLTTEKDMVRLLSMEEQILENYPVFYLPIELYFLKNEDSFAKILLSGIERGFNKLGLK